MTLPSPQSRFIAFSSGAGFETPLLVPSVSSRGFSRLEDGASEVRAPLELVAPLVADALLVSAYDLKYDLIPGREGLRNYPRDGVLGNPEALFIDSGGYEVDVAANADLNRFPYVAERWTEGDYDDLLAGVDPRNDIVIVNLENRGTVEAQVEAANAFFSRHDTFLTDFLIKPSKDATFLSERSVIERAATFGAFDIIGVTEKELGTSLQQRLALVARLRAALDAGGITVPIHIFGSLDPLLSPIYWLAGAEIFDGLSWITMAYDPDLYLTIYSDALPARRNDWTHHERRRRSEIWANNISVRERMMLQMKEFLISSDFRTLGPQSEVIRNGVAALESALRGRRR